MIRGLVIGKFMPIHQGHVALIRFALEHCDQLVVSMSYTQHDPIPADLRRGWIEEIFRDIPRVNVQVIHDDFDNESLPWPARTKVWAEKLKSTYGNFDRVFSSEPYGSFLAANLNAEHFLFDVDRTKFPVSATKVRNHPFSFWQFIPNPVRPFFAKKICFYGPESTGKSVLSKKMAERFQTEWVPEVAREMITSNEFTIDDIIAIGNAQTQRVLEKSKTANRILICDTDLITTQIYCRHYLGTVPEILYELERQVAYDLYFLFDIDVPWVNDGMRDLGSRREEMFNVFKSELEKRNIPFVLVRGTYEQREERVVKEIEKLLNAFS